VTLHRSPTVTLKLHGADRQVSSRGVVVGLVIALCERDEDSEIMLSGRDFDTLPVT